MDTLMHVLVLTCGDLGFQVAERLVTVPGVARVTLVTSPYRQPKRTLGGKVKYVWRTQGPIGLVRIFVTKLTRSRRATSPDAERKLPEALRVLQVEDFHAPGALTQVRALAPDLGVVAGTYILQACVFEIPRLGSINLHSGKAPEY